MSKLTSLRVDTLEAAAGVLDFFVFAEQKWCTWDKLEESIAKVDYEKLKDKELDWFIEFMSNCIFRVWRSSKENPKLNEVKEDAIGFFIYNYDWNAYKFACEKGNDKEIRTDNILLIDKEKLSTAEIKWLRSKSNA